jgi:hypothetical protein
MKEKGATSLVETASHRPRRWRFPQNIDAEEVDWSRQRGRKNHLDGGVFPENISGELPTDPSRGR